MCGGVYIRYIYIIYTYRMYIYGVEGARNYESLDLVGLFGARELMTGTVFLDWYLPWI